MKKEKKYLEYNIEEKAKKLGMKATQYAREMTLKGGIKSRFTIEELDLMRNSQA